MKIKYKLLLSSSLVLISLTCLFFVSYAWIIPNNKVDNSNTQGHTQAAYFAGGNGTQKSPYIINQPIHLYNLAWLQYLGEFNNSSNGTQEQYYFTLEADLDMSNLNLPPIGTSSNPFIGNFDGTDKTISNLTTTNNIAELQKKPHKVSNLENVEIVGFFGVVGNINGVVGTYDTKVNVKSFTLANHTSKTITNQTLIGSLCGYVNGNVENVKLIEPTIYVSENSSQMEAYKGVSEHSTIGHSTPAYLNTIKQKIVSLYDNNIERGEANDGGLGDENDWGGSIDMKAAFTRTQELYNAATTNNNYPNEITTLTDINGNYNEVSRSTTSIRTYESPNKGRYVFSDSTSADYSYLYGGYKFINDVETNDKFFYRIYNGTSYLYIDTTSNPYTLKAGTEAQAEATEWYFTDPETIGYIYTTLPNPDYIPGQEPTPEVPNPETLTYYLTVSHGTSLFGWTDVKLAISSVESNRVTWSKSINSEGKVDGIFVNVPEGFLGSTNTPYYITLSGTSFNLQKNNPSNKAIYRKDVAETTDIVINRNYSTNADLCTYMPLNVVQDGSLTGEKYDVIPTNTGYITSACYNNLVKLNESWFQDLFDSNGDVRISRYNINNLTNGFNGSAYTNNVFNEDSLKVWTINTSTSLNSNNHNFVEIGENYDSLGLNKYVDARKTMREIFKSEEANSTRYMYGLHFMRMAASTDAQSVIHDKMVASQVTINEKTYTNYELPLNNIDFTLKKRGYINFFAGTYYGSRNFLGIGTGINQNFFSLKSIIRDPNDPTKILEVKYIRNIYKPMDNDETKPYIYEYTDNSFSSELPSDYELCFKAEWLTEPRHIHSSSYQNTIIENGLYYFEIPVNEGEYALGSTPSKDGAYLLYLDISASAKPRFRTRIAEKFHEVDNEYLVPSGISLIKKSETSSLYELYDSISILLDEGFKGSYVYSKNGENTSNNIAYNFTPLGNSSPEYIKPHFIPLDHTLNSDSNYTLTPNSTSEKTTKRLTMHDFINDSRHPANDPNGPHETLIISDVYEGSNKPTRSILLNNTPYTGNKYWDLEIPELTSIVLEVHALGDSKFNCNVEIATEIHKENDLYYYIDNYNINFVDANNANIALGYLYIKTFTPNANYNYYVNSTKITQSGKI